MATGFMPVPLGTDDRNTFHHRPVDISPHVRFVCQSQVVNNVVPAWLDGACCDGALLGEGGADTNFSAAHKMAETIESHTFRRVLARGMIYSPNVCCIGSELGLLKGDTGRGRAFVVGVIV